MDKPARILVVDDEPAIQELLRHNLTREGYEVEVAADGHAALAAAGRADLIILDLMLPGLDGLTVCREIRRRSDVPILMLTARAEDTDKIVGLEVGADDYVTKPFNVRELVARVRAILRRARRDEGPPTQRLQVGDIALDLEARQAYVGAREVNLSPTEFRLLEVLMENRGRVLSRDQLLDRVWGADYAGDPRVVDVYIRYLREKLEPDPSHPTYIETVRGAGYRFRRA